MPGSDQRQVDRPRHDASGLAIGPGSFAQPVQVRGPRRVDALLGRPDVVILQGPCARRHLERLVVAVVVMAEHQAHEQLELCPGVQRRLLIDRIDVAGGVLLLEVCKQVELVSGYAGEMMVEGALAEAETSGKIVEIDVVADPERVRRLDLAVLDD